MKAALIGTGQIAQQHLACLRLLPVATLAGVCDLSRSLAEAAAERYGIAAWFTDHLAMLDQVRPDVVHITTPPQSHYSLARDALAARAHVIVEKPIATAYDQVAELLHLASEQERVLIEDYNYLYNPPIQRILELVRSSELGEVVDVEVSICVDILAEGSPFVDRGVPHPCVSLPGGAIADFLSHLASLAHGFVGPHRAVRTHWSKRSTGSPLPYDEFRAVVAAERGTAFLSFSAHAQPEMFRVQVNGTRMRAAADLYDGNLVINRLDAGPRPIARLRDRFREARDVRRAAADLYDGNLVINGLGAGPRPIARLRDRFREARDVRRAARRNLLGKFTGPGAYAGLWNLLARAYQAVESETEPPISTRQIAEVNELVTALTAEENRF